MASKLSYTDIIFIKITSSISTDARGNCIRRFTYSLEATLNVLSQPTETSLIFQSINIDAFNHVYALYQEAKMKDGLDVKYVKQCIRDALTGLVKYDNDYTCIVAPLIAGDVNFSKQHAIKVFQEDRHRNSNSQKISKKNQIAQLKLEALSLAKQRKEKEDYKQIQNEILESAEIQIDNLLCSKFLNSLERHELLQKFSTEKTFARIQNRKYNFCFLDETVELIETRSQEEINIYKDCHKPIVRPVYKRLGRKYVLVQGGLIY